MNPTPPPHISPADAQLIATAYIKAGTQILIELLTGGFAIWAFITAQLAKLHAKQNEKRIDRQGDTLKNVLRDMPAPDEKKEEPNP